MPKRTRMMVAQLFPRSDAREYAKLSTTDKSKNVDVGDGYLATSSSATEWGIARANVALSSGVYYWETRHYFGSDDCTAGLSSQNSNVDVKLGSASFGISGPDKNGDFYANGILVLNLSSVTSGVRIRHLFDADAGLYKIAIAGGSFNTVWESISSNWRVWHPAVAVKGDGECEVNFGQSDFFYSVPAGAKAGVYQRPPEPVQINVSSHTFITGPVDEEPNVVYDARIAREGDVTVTREGTCWVWGNQAQSSRGQLSLVINDRLRAQWANLIWRNATVKIWRGYVGDTFADLTPWATVMVEKETFTANRLTLALTSVWASLDRAIVTALYPNDTPNEQLVNQVRPYLFGAPRYCEGRLYSTSEFGDDAFTYEFNDAQPLMQVDVVYDRGDMLAAPPTDWGYRANGLGVKLVNKPDGKVVADPQGGWNVFEEIMGPSNGGNFTSWVSGLVDDDPAGWIVINESSGRMVSPGGAYGTVVMQSSGGRVARMQIDYLPTAGEKYLVVVDVESVTGSGLQLGEESSGFDYFITTPGRHAFIYTGHETDNFELCGDSSADGTVVIRSVLFQRVGAVVYLGDVAYHFLQQRGGVDPASLDLSTFTNIGFARPYVLADYRTGSVSFHQQMHDVCDSFCGSIFTKRNGQISMFTAGPITETPSGTFDDSRLRGKLMRTADEAKELTTVLLGRRNYSPYSDGDLATSLTTEERERFKSQYLLRRSGVPAAANQSAYTEKEIEQLSPQTEQGVSAVEKATLIQDEDSLQAEASRVATTWEPPMYFYEGEYFMEDNDADDVEPGQVKTVISADHNLQAGLNMRVKAVTSSFWSNVVRIKFHGPKPEDI